MKQQKVKISVVTVNFNNAKDTVACVKSFSKVNKTDLDISIMVVNNGCTEADSLNIKNQLPEVILLNSATNLGFAGGNNLGIKEGLKNKSDYILLINNDATVENKDFFQNLLDSKEDILSPLIIFKKNRMTFHDFGGKIDWIFGRNTHLNFNVSENKLNSKPDYFSGACLLIKSKIFKKIGFLDEKYFLYYEDVDFCLRAKHAGFSLGINTNSHIFHHLSATASKFGKRKTLILASSHLRFCRSYLPIFSVPLYISFNLYLRLKTYLL